MRKRKNPWSNMSGKEKRERRQRMDSCAARTRNDQSASRRPHSQPAYKKRKRKEKKSKKSINKFQRVQWRRRVLVNPNKSGPAGGKSPQVTLYRRRKASPHHPRPFSPESNCTSRRRTKERRKTLPRVHGHGAYAEHVHTHTHTLRAHGKGRAT